MPDVDNTRKRAKRGAGLAWIRALVESKPWPEECVLWPGRLDDAGYGRLPHGGMKAALAHRVAYILAFGPTTLHVLHGKDRRCVSQACCNPGHLRAGTQQENMADRTRDGTTARGDNSSARLHPETHARGDTSGRSKLTSAIVDEIRRRSQEGETNAALGRAFDVHRSQISRILSGKTWVPFHPSPSSA